MTPEFFKDFTETRETQDDLPMEAFDTFDADGVETFCFKELREAWALWQRAKGGAQ